MVGDLINRHLVQEAITKSIELKENPHQMFKRVQGIPSADRPTGHWILQPSNKEQGERDFIWWKCSECGQVIYSETEKDRREYHVFCSRCGAKME